MASAVPLTIQTEEVIAAALRLRSAKEGAAVDEVVNAILRKALAPEIEETCGVPPLAAVIQTHHTRQQEALRQQSNGSKPSAPPA